MSSDNGTSKIGEGAEKRIHDRVPIITKIKITHASFGSIIVKTKNLSHGGICVLTENTSILPVGRVLEGQIQDGEENRPIVKIEVVRIGQEGVGLKFLD
ncbi:MAG: PilZ domain-containing protein [Gammaproteobacteria bacterium]|nr:PilZ domain-containing protein [Gammaproteobacteria bacterium]